MKLDLETERPSEIREPVAFPHEEEAVRIQEEISSLTHRIEELEARRDEAIAKALENGIKRYGGYRFGTKNPASTLSERKLAELYPDLMDQYIDWFKETHPARLSKPELSKFLESINHVNPDLLLAEITEPGKGKPTVTITKQKEAGE